MGESSPEKLVRGMYDASVVRPMIEEDNDIDAPFTVEGPVGIPEDLQALIHQPQSVDPEPEEIPQIHTELTIDIEKVTEENSQSRFRILDLPIKKPGVCALCGSSGGDGRQFVDFGKTMEWVGVIYFCTFCVSEAAKLLGFDGRTSDWELAEKNLQEEISAGDDRWVNAQEEIRALNLLLRNHLNGDCCTHTSDLEITDADVIEPESSGDDDESNDQSEPDSDESDPVEGSDDIPADSNGDVEPEPKPARRTRKSTG